MEHPSSPVQPATPGAIRFLRGAASSLAALRIVCTSVLILLLSGLLGSAQDSGAVSGTVVNSFDGAPLSGATVTVRGTTLATQTDSTGRFELKGLPLGDQVLRFSKSGFAAAVVTDVRVIVGQTTTVNGNLRPEFYEMEEYEVTAEEFAQQADQILIERQESGAMVDALGSEQFSKLGANDAGQIVARVTGVSVVGGKYAVVRGLSDRYTRTLMNGVEVPSADPYKLSPQLDLFPAAMIDRISVSKTFTPDQPGGTGGGTIDIVTKSFPEKPFVKATVGTSYNPNSNLRNDFLAAPESSMSMVGVPSGPEMVGENLFGLTTVPTLPGPASTRETVATANARRQQANAAQSLLQELGTANFAGTQQESPLNSGFAVSAGKTTTLFGQKLGVFGGGNYKREFLGQNETQIGRYSEAGTPEYLGTRQQGNIKTDYGANFNLGFEPWEHSLLGFNFMLAHSTDEEARHDDYYFNESSPTSLLQKWQVHHTDRQILNYQLTGQHELEPLLDSKLEWVVAMANTTQEEPDQRFMNYYVQGGQPVFGDAGLPFPQYPSRYFREIEEDGVNYRVDWTLPLDFLPEETKIKTGYFGSSNEREFKEQYFSYNLSQGFDLNNPNTYLNDPAYLQYTPSYLGNSINGVGRTNYSFARYVAETYAHPYTASLDVNAVYLMADVGLLPWLRFIGGVRLEKTLLDVNAPRDGTAHIDQTDALPAVSLVVTLVTNVNLRLSYGETVSRPSYREIAPVQSYLPDLDLVAQGNPNLEMIAITSYDLRVEWFPAPGDVLSAGVFYKQLERPIELISLSAGDDLVTWINRDNAPADLMGIELEARKSMEFLSPQLRGLSLGINASFIESSTKLTEVELINKREVDPFASDTRPLYDQSPYIINLDVTYDHPTSGTSFSIGANMTGERIVLTKTRGPDLYEHPPLSLDAAVSQKFWQHWTARFGVKNLLDGEYRKTYGAGYEGNIYEAYRRGRTYSLSLSVEF